MTKGTPRASNPRKSAAKSRPLAGSKAKPARLLSGGNPQIAKADGDAPVQAYIAALPGWKRDIGRRLDALIERNVPDVRKAVKWNSPFYGIEGRGWFLGIHAFTHYVKVTFFRGTSLRPLPPGPSKVEHTRSLDIRGRRARRGTDVGLGQTGGRVAGLGPVVRAPRLAPSAAGGSPGGP
jgi:hypothetical protein